MEDLDFTKPSQSPIYDRATALAFFKSAGTEESLAQGQTFFVERRTRHGLFQVLLHKDDKMYLLTEGEVSLMIGNKVIDILKPGEIFGEMAPISEMPRSATAVANTACRAISMKRSRFLKALSGMPEFALMLMSVMSDRLRRTDARLGASPERTTGVERHEGRVFEKEILAALRREAGDITPLRVMPGKTIMTVGETGLYMYIVLEGRVAVSVQDKVVERVGPGGVLGDMALVDRSPRAASAAAETGCSLLPISRQEFLALVKKKPAFGMALLKTLADRLRFITSQIPSN